jgi:hypothetical protein
MNGNIIKTTSTLATEAIFSKDNNRRYLLRKTWDNNKTKAAIVLLYPSYSDAVLCDTTTTLTINSIATLDFGGVDILNISPVIGGKGSITDAKTTDRLNDSYILDSAKDSSKIIIATGRGNNKAVMERTEEVIRLLDEYKDKIYYISDGKNFGYHPLSPRIRYKWNLVSYSDAVAAAKGD